MIAANKVDLSSSDRQVTKDEGDQFALDKLGDAALHMETSGKIFLFRPFSETSTFLKSSISSTFLSKPVILKARDLYGELSGSI